MKKKITLLSITILIITVLTACGENDNKSIETIVFADAGWDSMRVHNHITGTIIEEGYGYETDDTTGSTPATVQGLRDGDINVFTELWTDNIKEVYDEAIEKGDIKKLSVNFDDNEQGMYVPTYVIEGDPERNIEPMAPDLETMEDLKDYPEVFEDPEDPSRGRIINGPSGWVAQEAVSKKFETYGLDETMNDFIPGSDSALVADLMSAYESGEPWVGLYWSPTWVTAKLDLTILEEPEFDREQWNENKGTKFPPNDVVVAVHKDFPDQAPEVAEFLENYETSTELTEEALNYMNDNDASEEEAAMWWMEKREDI